MPARDPVRILHVVLSLNPGGTERLVLDLIGASPPASAAVCCLDEAGQWGEAFAREGGRLVALHRPPGFQPGLSRRLRKVAGDFRAEVLHCHHYSPFVYGQMAAVLAGGLPVIYTEHGRLNDHAPSRKRRLVNPWLCRLSFGNYAVSEDLRLHMVAEGFAGDRIGVIYNGIRIGSLPTVEHRAVARKSLGLPDDAMVIGAVGRIDPVKNLAMLCEAFAAAARRMQPQEVYLVIVGHGPELAATTERVAANALQDRVLFTGYRSDVEAILPAFDIYVNTSVHEGVSLTILEAMAAGLPVVATAVGGTPEVVADGETGVLVPSRDVSACADAFVSLGRSRETRNKMGRAGRARVEARFGSERMVDAYFGLYEQAGRH